MTQTPRKTAVIGAGVMGAKIAAHIANAGIPVYLLDVLPEGGSDRNAVAESAIEGLLRPSSTPAFTDPDHAERIIPGNIEDHLPLLNGVDWIVEAVVERLDVKRALYSKIEQIRNPSCIVSSNTSTFRLDDLTREMPETFVGNFLITHFFNPPRYMRLSELIAGPRTRPEIVRTIGAFIDKNLGKSIVECKDRPGFICNRIGMFWLQCALHEAISRNLDIEIVDAAFSKALGQPKTGVFGLFDLIGLDLIPHIVASLQSGLPADDPFQTYGRIPERYNDMLTRGLLGRKSQAGFYRIRRVDQTKVSESIDLESGEYRPTRQSHLEFPVQTGVSPIRTLLEMPTEIGQFAWKVVSETLNNAAGLVPEIADNLADIDRAMRLGFNWDAGPFELIDRIGIDYLVNRIRQDGNSPNGLLNVEGPMYRSSQGILKTKNPNGQFSPLRTSPGILSLADIKRRGEPLLESPGASLWDIGEGALCFEFHTRMNALNRDILRLLQRSIDLATEQFSALVIYNDGPNFSAGANLKDFLDRIEDEDWVGMETLIREGQQVYQALKTAPLPVIGAPSGFALGGGAEILLHCDAIQAHIELRMGLVETGIGLIPAWGGCKEMLFRNANANAEKNANPAEKTFLQIAERSVSQSAEIAKAFNFLQPGDSITMNRDRLLADAKAKALDLTQRYRVPESSTHPIEIRSADDWFPEAVNKISSDQPISDYERIVLERLAYVLSAGGSGGRVDAQSLLDLECETFSFLIRQPETRQRIQHMLKTGKPLAN